MHVRCPHCANPLEIVEESKLSDILCGHCGSQFELGADGTKTDASTPARLLGRFQLVKRIGEGSFGVVWKAHDTELDRLVAIKIPHPELFTSTTIGHRPRLGACEISDLIPLHTGNDVIGILKAVEEPHPRYIINVASDDFLQGQRRRGTIHARVLHSNCISPAALR